MLLFAFGPARPIAAYAYRTDRSPTLPAIPADGDAIEEWDDVLSGIEAEQPTAGLRPIWRLAVWPGLAMLEFSSDRQLAAPIPDVAAIALVVEPAALERRVLAARDTSQAGTTLPAFEIALVTTLA